MLVADICIPSAYIKVSHRTLLFWNMGSIYTDWSDFYTRFLLSSHSPGKIAWIGSLQLMMPFFLGAVSGKLFDAGHFHVLEVSGGIIFTLS
jgi:hypothetical protein